MTVIDCHVHVIAADRSVYPVLSEEDGPSTDWYLSQGVTVEELSDLMSGAGVDGAVLVQPASAYANDNRYVLESAERHPDRFVGVAGATVHPITSRDVREFAAADSFGGLRLFDTGSGVLSDPRTVPVATELASQGLPLVVHTNLENMSDVVALVRAVPDLTLVLDHCALSEADVSATAPWDGDGPLAALMPFDRVVLKVTPIVVAHATSGAGLVSRFGSERIVWGSDFCHTPGPYAGIVELIARFLDDVEPRFQDAIWGSTAAQLWPQLPGGRRSPLTGLDSARQLR